uniref:Lectin, mannose-binding, 1 n=1 Tax=Oryzias sinensis TaxID=183150 RepID=A0A8C7YR27_9TELE
MAVCVSQRPALYFVLSFLAAATFHRSVADVATDGSKSEEPPHRRFEYKYSFKGPHLAQSDGSIPFWIHGGSAIPSADQVRITPSLRSQRGSVWTKNKVNFEHWEAEVTFRVSGRGRTGADGLAVWFSTAQGIDGPVYGAADRWDGIGIFFDSFDNDAKKNNPAIIVVGNNGNLVYDHQKEKTTTSMFFYQVMINNGFTPDKEDYEFCTKVENMVIPTEGFFGISAATGGLADDHDVLSFLLFRLTEPGQQPPSVDAEIPKEEKDKYQEEFENFQQELDKKKEEFQKEHPNVQGEPIEDYESVNEREIRQVFEGQNRIHLEIKQLNRQLAMILDEQRRHVSVITDEINKKATSAGCYFAFHFQVESQQLGSVIATQQEVLKSLNELRTSFHNSLNQIGSVQQGNAAGMGTYETIQHFNDIKEHLHAVKRDVEQLAQRNNPAEKAVKCPEMPPMPSCLSTVHFAIFVVIQSVLFFCYVMYKSQQEAAAKKFF